MNRTELILVMSTTLFAAFVLGWLLRWAYGRLNRVNSVDVTEIDDLAARLHDAKVALDETRKTLAQKEAELAAAMDEARNTLAQKEAELAAAMGGIGNARRETEDLRDQLERLRAAK